MTLSRSRLTRRLLLAGLVLSTGCASTRINRLDAIPRRPRLPSEIQLLTAAPQRPYKAIAQVEVSNEGWGASADDLRDRLIRAAARLGGDALILNRPAGDSTATAIPIGSRVLTGPEALKKSSATVILYIR